MYLMRLEVQGFKTFAKKTAVEFPGAKKSHNALTVIVGPNGSGKSNLADAIRWCLGEQSMKQLRGKKTEDIIFSGSKGKARSGFAEVVMTFNNEDKAMNVDYTEVTITRRLYRDGDSEYLLNGKRSRLSDIQLLLAEAGVGQRTYSVIGQGMIDHVLTSSPEERKVFFDDATGVRGLQIKRHQSMLKLKKASENLVEVEMLLSEIEPRLRTLKRMVKRLEKREGYEVQLHELQMNYYSTLWWDLQDHQSTVRAKLAGFDERITKKRAELAKGDKQLEEMEKVARGDAKENTALVAAQAAYKKAQQDLAEARKKQFEAERELELAKVKAQSTWAPLPLSNIISELEAILKADEETTIKTIFKMVRTLRDRLTKPNPEDFKPDPAMLNAIDTTKNAVADAEAMVKETEATIDTVSKASAETKTEVFDFQRTLRKIQGELHTLEHEQNEIKIDLARIETRIDGITNEMKEEIADMRDKVMAGAPATRLTNADATRTEILKIKHQLELIGSIDEETVQEYEETSERFEFLNGQVVDIREAIKQTETVIDELDEQIRKQSEKAFKKINDEFQKYFKVLFGGGSCSLIKLKESDRKKEEAETKVALDRAMEDLAQDKIEEDNESTDAIMARVKKRRDMVAGIDIQATPPGKKLKSLNLLSGGERALTSIALLSAIMATNPSPFVVLDEVDAALDEANTIRFANILNELRKLTQFVVITHNRATMERADLLYGVTMGDDGVSNLLSVSMSDIEDAGSARR